MFNGCSIFPMFGGFVSRQSNRHSAPPVADLVSANEHTRFKWFLDFSKLFASSIDVKYANAIVGGMEEYLNATFVYRFTDPRRL